MNIFVTPELERFVTEQVASGRYSSPSEVVREALRLLEERDQVRSAQLAAFNQELGDRLASLDRGEHVDSTVVQHTLEERDTAVEQWLREDVATVFDRMQTAPDRAIPAETAFDAVRRRHAERGKHSA